jgi:hypothetical protein
MSLETLAFFHVTTDEGDEKKVYAGDVLKAVRRAFPQRDAEFFIVRKLTYASGGVISDPDKQLVRGPAWPRDGSGDERVYNMMHGVEQADEQSGSQDELERMAEWNDSMVGTGGQDDYTAVDRESQLDDAEERLAAAHAEVNRLRVPTLDELNDAEACRMMQDEEASEYLATVR